MNKLSRALGFAAILALLLLIIACNKTPVQPKRAEFVLYAGITAHPPEVPEAYVAIIDCRTDSVIDSVIHNFGSDVVGVGGSPDGRYFATMTAQRPPVLIWDAATKTPLADLPRFVGAIKPLFLPDAGLVITPERGVTRIFRLSDFALDTALDLELFRPERIPGSQKIIGVDQRLGPTYVDDSRLAIYDYVAKQEVDSIIINPDEDGFGFEVGHIEFSPDGRIMYLAGRDASAGIELSIAAYDLDQKRLLYIQPLVTGAYGFGVTPDGREIWATSPWPDRNGEREKTIDIYDAASGVFIDSVLLSGYVEELAPHSIEFVPTGAKAYVACGNFPGPNPIGAQPILVIDTQQREVVKLIYPDFKHAALTIDVVPKL